MKRRIILIAIAIFGVNLTSCAKKYGCECYYMENGQKTILINISGYSPYKSIAKASCKGTKNEVQSNPDIYGENATCKLITEPF